MLALGTAFEISYQVFCLSLTVNPPLLLLVLFRTVLLDELGDKMTIGAMSVGNCAEPVRFLWSCLDVLFRYESSAVMRYLRDKDRVLVDFRSASAPHVTGYRIGSKLLDIETAIC